MGGRTVTSILAVLFAGCAVFAQVPQTVLEHRPLPLEEERSYETARAAVPVLEETVLSGRAILRFANRPDHRATGAADDPDYADYGQFTARVSLEGQDLSRFDRIVFDVKTACDDDRVVNLNMGYGAVSHFVHLRNDATLTCFLDLTEPGRETARELFFTVTNRGPYRTTRDSSRFEVSKIRLQRLADPAVDRGWRPQGIVHSTAGYAAGAVKTAVVPFSAGRLRWWMRRPDGYGIGAASGRRNRPWAPSASSTSPRSTGREPGGSSRRDGCPHPFPLRQDPGRTPNGRR